MSATYSEQAPAKVNLFLHVTGKRDDGYHLLESLVCFTAAGDVLSGELRDDGKITLSITGPMTGLLSLEDTESNLVTRAAKTLQTLSGTSLGADLILDKRLPIASGIGVARPMRLQPFVFCAICGSLILMTNLLIGLHYRLGLMCLFACMAKPA